MGNISKNIELIRSEIPDQVKLVAVSKTKPNKDILEAFNAGQMIFGENKVQDLVDKAEVLPKEIQWHYIGHLQTNKVKYIAPFISLIHAVDSLKLLKEINKHAKKNDRIISCLLQFHIATEDSKFGLDVEAASNILNDPAYKEMHNINICGVMGMASYTNNQEQVAKEFTQLKVIFKTIKNEFFIDKIDFGEISMGMSGDYQLAIENGSTMIRVGSSIFGTRNY